MECPMAIHPTNHKTGDLDDLDSRYGAYDNASTGSRFGELIEGGTVSRHGVGGNAAKGLTCDVF